MPEEVFHGSIIPAVTPPGHGGGNPISAGKEMVGVRTVLTPLIAVQDQPLSNALFPFGLLDRLGYQVD